ncbi:flagellar biosynthesis protein FlhF [Radiobacillus kanasensis]|uniref:flagellar biosynthesis protein FlhF n=1 Tax=Radiobacillus kanasensis TaxID=2844358 RepID=UPI001E546913|nr:flagellar biosynthesis protein FlhF [Radiobacillus kanasensis]UFU01042.1 flagellar biosynthesis protein FlhF [Radiobacillus kanasensis]
MKVKKFIAPTMPEVMNQIRKDLGADAVILNSKVVLKGGFLGLFKKRNVEVIAALDPAPKKSKEELKLAPTSIVQEVKRKEPPVAEPAPRPVSKPNQQDDLVLKEIKELKAWVAKHGTQPSVYPEAIQSYYEYLLEQEVQKEMAKELMDTVMTDYVESRPDALKQLVSEAVHDKLSKLPFGKQQGNQKFIHFVGPTGVGKTTTIAKIAADQVLNQKKKVAFITMDTYRIAAIDQLRTYSKILEVPLEIAYSLADYQEARKKFSDYDLVLVDTAGRNFRDPAYISQLEEILDVERDFDTYLVLSLTTRTKDLHELVSQFMNIPIKQLIFTKKDETSVYGAILNLCTTYGLGVAYLTNGQDVPDDIEELSVSKICEMIVGDL